MDFLTAIAPGVHAHVGAIALPSPANAGDTSNMGVVIGNDAVAVIDTGGSRAIGRAFAEAVRRLTDKPIRYVINTHEHPDHILGNACFASPATTFVAHRNMPGALAERADHYIQSYREMLGADAVADADIVLPTLLVDETLSLDLGGRMLDLIAWRPAAHTDCDLTVLDRASGTLFGGDLVFAQHVPVVDGTVAGFRAVAARLAGLAAARVVPGHGDAILDWPAGIKPERRYLDRLADDAGHAVASGTPLAQAVQSIGAPERAFWSLFDDYNPRNATVAYSEAEWD